MQTRGEIVPYCLMPRTSNPRPQPGLHLVVLACRDSGSLRDIKVKFNLYKYHSDLTATTTARRATLLTRLRRTRAYRRHIVQVIILTLSRYSRLSFAPMP